MSDDGLTAGREVDGMCTRCKLLTGHTIVAMVDGAPKRVKCNSCGSLHRFIPPPEETPGRGSKVVVRAAAGRRKEVMMVERKTAGKRKPATPRKGRAAKPKAPPPPDHETEFDRLCEGRETVDPRPYLISETYEPDELLEHKVFGLGLVIGVRGGGKVDVMFRQAGPKTLVHQRAG